MRINQQNATQFVSAAGVTLGLFGTLRLWTHDRGAAWLQLIYAALCVVVLLRSRHNENKI